MVVRPGLVTGGNFLWGGCGLAAAVAAIEELSGRTCVWATAQYLSYARTGETRPFPVPRDPPVTFVVLEKPLGAA
jgi:hypothetical protein